MNDDIVAYAEEAAIDRLPNQYVEGDGRFNIPECRRCQIVCDVDVWVSDAGDHFSPSVPPLQYRVKVLAGICDCREALLG